MLDLFYNTWVYMYIYMYMYIYIYRTTVKNTIINNPKYMIYKIHFELLNQQHYHNPNILLHDPNLHHEY